MEGIIVILLIFFLFATRSKKGNDRPASTPRGVAPGPQAQASQPAATPVARMTPEERRQRIEELKRQKQARQAAAKAGKAAGKLPGNAAQFVSAYTQLKQAMEAALEPAAPAQPAPAEPEAPFAGEGMSRPGSLAAAARQGSSLFDDDEGCVGGSLPHDHHEGEAREEHARHMAAMAAKDAEDAAFAAPRAIAALDATKLRRAVVISEILGKPKALQRKAG